METLQNSKPTKANKSHKCDYCNQLIEKGSVYMCSTHVYEGEIYKWRTHNYCAEIVTKLDLWSFCDEGVTQEDFIESIKEEFNQIMIKTDLEKYESKEFVIPKFNEQLTFVLNHHNILATIDYNKALIKELLK